MLSLLLTASLAHAGSEIGTSKTVGLGAEVGTGAYLNVSAKFWMSEDAGLALHAGTLFVYNEIGARYEHNFYKGEWFDWADLPLWWLVGADAGFYSNAGYSAAQLGALGGVGAALQFSEFSGEAFVTTAAGIFPVNYCSGLGSYAGTACTVQGRGTVGFRYYF